MRPGPPPEAAPAGRSDGRSPRRARGGRRRRRGRQRRGRARRAYEGGYRCSRGRLDRERRLEREQLSTATHGGGADAHLGSDGLGAAECVSWILARRVGADDQAVGVGRGHVLRRVDRDVDSPVEQRFLEFFHEHAALADLAERFRPVAVAGRGDRDERDLDSLPAEPVAGQLGLSQREPATAASDSYLNARPPRGRRGAGRHRRSRSPRWQRPPSGARSGHAGACSRSASSAIRPSAARSRRGRRAVPRPWRARPSGSLGALAERRDRRDDIERGLPVTEPLGLVRDHRLGARSFPPAPAEAFG